MTLTRALAVIASLALAAGCLRDHDPALVQTGSDRDARLDGLEGWEAVYRDPLATVYRRLAGEATSSR